MTSASIQFPQPTPCVLCAYFPGVPPVGYVSDPHLCEGIGPVCDDCKEHLVIGTCYLLDFARCALVVISDADRNNNKSTPKPNPKNRR